MGCNGKVKITPHEQKNYCKFGQKTQTQMYFLIKYSESTRQDLIELYYSASIFWRVTVTVNKI